MISISVFALRKGSLMVASCGCGLSNWQHLLLKWRSLGWKGFKSVCGIHSPVLMGELKFPSKVIRQTVGHMSSAHTQWIETGHRPHQTRGLIPKIMGYEQGKCGEEGIQHSKCSLVTKSLFSRKIRNAGKTKPPPMGHLRICWALTCVQNTPGSSAVSEWRGLRHAFRTGGLG